MTALPTDLEIQQFLVPVRAAVLEATQREHSPTRSTRYRDSRAVIVAGVLAAALSAGAIAVSQAEPDSIDVRVTCFQHASLDSVSQEAARADHTLSPTDICGFVWDEGLLGEPVPADLVPCTLADGTVGVFPREDGPAVDTDFCAALGLADWDSD